MCMLPKCEDLNSDLQLHINKSQALWPLPATTATKRHILKAHGPARVPKLAASSPRHLISNNNVESNGGTLQYDSFMSEVYICVFACM